jgi:hypothetical protein
VRRLSQRRILPETPLGKNKPRLDLENFYYAQEDEYMLWLRETVLAGASNHIQMIGKAVGNLMNLGTTLAVYAIFVKKQTDRFVGQDQRNGMVFRCNRCQSTI